MVLGLEKAVSCVPWYHASPFPSTPMPLSALRCCATPRPAPACPHSSDQVSAYKRRLRLRFIEFPRLRTSRGKYPLQKKQTHGEVLWCGLAGCGLRVRASSPQVSSCPPSLRRRRKYPANAAEGRGQQKPTEFARSSKPSGAQVLYSTTELWLKLFRVTLAARACSTAPQRQSAPQEQEQEQEQRKQEQEEDNITRETRGQRTTKNR